ncbi:MAG: hypothetical protein OTJ45_01290 [Alphaproteobacteria bacterium]|nr:hypothetical protein [Alphaproteobacteria bacterium]
MELRPRADWLAAPPPLRRHSANFITPNDRHSAAYRGVLIEGVMTNPFGAEDPTNASRLAAGSDWQVPVGEAHATACGSDGPYRAYFHSAVAFDLKPVE